MDDSHPVGQKLKRLSRREAEVLGERCQGKSVTDIAETLVIVESTVKYHLGHIYAKLELDHLPQAARNLELSKFCEALRDVPTENIVHLEPEPEVQAPHPMSLVPVLEDELALVRQAPSAIQLWRPQISSPPADPPFPRSRPRGKRHALILLVTTAVLSGLTGAGIMTLIFTVTIPGASSTTPYPPPITLVRSPHETPTFVPTITPAASNTPSPTAQSLLQRGDGLAAAGDLEGAVALYEQALRFEPSLGEHPQTRAKNRRAEVLYLAGWRLVRERNVKEAIAAYTEAQELNPDLPISVVDWDELCVLGNLEGYASDVINICRRAVNLALESDDRALKYQICLHRNFDGLATIVAPVCIDAAVPYGKIALGETVTIDYDPMHNPHLWIFEGTTGQKITIRLNKDPASPGLLPMGLLGPDGETLIEAWYRPRPGTYTVNINTVIDRSDLTELPKTGTYTIIIEHGTDSGTYTLSLE